MAKKTQLALTPRLRFPEFRTIPSWMTYALSQFISTLDAGVSVNAGDRSASNAEIGILKTSCVSNGVFDPSENKVVLDPYELRRVSEPVVGGTIIISRMNTIDLVGANAYVEHDAPNLFLPDRLWAAKGIPNANMRYLAHVLGSVRGRQGLSLLAAGSSGSMKNISKAAVLKLQMYAPEPAEQAKIADCLTSLDEVITAQARKVEALKTYKRGLMQQLFPREGEMVPRLRFPEFRDGPEWEEASVGGRSKSFSGGTPSTSEMSYYGGKIPFIRSAEIAEERTELFLTDQGLENSAAKLVSPGDVLVALYGANSGDVAVARIGGAINQAILCLRPEGSNAFLYHILTAKREWILATFIQGGQGNLSGDIVKSVALRYPSEEEQRVVADCLSALDARIAAEVARVATLTRQKCALMQQLFPPPANTGA